MGCFVSKNKFQRKSSNISDKLPCGSFPEMRVLFALLVACIARVTGQLSAGQLASRWDMADTPAIAYDSESNTFTIDYLGASSTQIDMQEEFYDVNCKDDGSGFPEKVKRQYFSDPSDSSKRPKMTIGSTTNRPELKFTIDTQAMANDADIYEVVGENPTSCLGQYYDVKANVTLGVNADTWQTEGEGDLEALPFRFRIWDRKNNVEVYNSGTLYVWEVETSYITRSITDLCRDTDYDFYFITGNNFETSNLPYVQLEYDSSGTPDILFKKTPDEMIDITVEQANALEPGAQNVLPEGAGALLFTELFSLPENPQNPATNLEGQDGKGMMKFCVRGGIGYKKNGYTYDIDDADEDLATLLANGYQEVNFIESLVTIFYDLTAGFDVDSFNVDPKERVETTASKEAYGLEAWLCESGDDDAVFQAETWDGFVSYGRYAPIAISDNFKVGATTPEYFNQGALITICVAPVKEAWADGIRMDGITDFEWLRNDLSNTFVNNANNLPTTDIKQPAIVDGEASSNLLTSYIESDCEGGKHFCRFSSILFADFYITTGAVSGSGNAKLVFGTAGNRRLGESESAHRQLQADEGGESPFDLQVPVDMTDTGSAGLKTAAGMPFAASTFTIAVALICAALLD